MNCKKVQDLLLTNCLDTQVSAELLDTINAHLHTCAECTMFKSLLHEHAVLPFKKSEMPIVPNIIWGHITTAIEQEKRSFLFNILCDMRHCLRFIVDVIKHRKMTFALINISVAMIFVLLFFPAENTNNVLINEYLREHITFLTSLDPDTQGTTESAIDFNTTIEQFFM